MDDKNNPFSEHYKEEGVDEDRSSISDDFEEIDIYHNDTDEQSELNPKISADAIAEYLLKKGLLLTALEYHMELLENGRELPRLRNYFSNPGNFVQGTAAVGAANKIYRSSSISTFDSLDLTHSDDGGQVDDRVAVLEFELRQANETIRSLRMSLTGAIDEDSFLKMDVDGKESFDPITRRGASSHTDTSCNPLLKRAMNYLVNEYLMQNGYKLSSITLAEEIDDQDFEDWDDVGLNMSKPPNLLKLFQEYSVQNLQNVHKCDIGVETDNYLSDVEKQFEECKTLIEAVKKENERLSSSVGNLTKDSEDVKDDVRTLVSENVHQNHESYSSFMETNLKKTHPAMWKDLYSFWDDSNTWLFKEASKVASNSDELVASLTSSIPKIIFCVDLENRDKLVPILLSTAAMQQNANMRYSLLHSLFNLIDKPDKQQRQVILSGCVAYSNIVGYMQAEEDVLTQFWEQIGHKHSERRHLVAEACGAIAPMLRPEMRGSLLLSILQQMEQEEKSEKVRLAIAKSLAVLICVLHDEDKYFQIRKLCLKLANDHAWSVHEISCRYLLPALGCWSLRIGKFCEHLFDEYLKGMESFFSSSNTSDENHMKSVTPLFLLAAENLISLLPCLLYAVVSTVAESEEPAESIRPLVRFDDEVFRLNWVFENDEEYVRLYTYYNHHVCQKNVNCSENISSCLYNFIPRLADLLKKINSKNRECVSMMCKLFSSFVILFGLEFATNFLTEQKFDVTPAKVTDVKQELSSNIPVFVCGILSTIHSFRPSDKLSNFLNATLVTLATTYSPLDSLMVSIIELRRNEMFHDPILDVLWDGATHPSKYVRKASGELFQVMAVTEVSVSLLQSKVLPALLILAKDKEDIVKLPTLKAFGGLLQCSDIGDDVFDQVISQFGAFLAPADLSASDHPMNVAMVQVMGEVTPKADPKFCNDFALPHLAAVAAKNNQETNRTKKSDLALEMMKAFSNISFCYIPDSLLQSAFLPGLRCLLQDLEKTHPEHVSRVERLIKDMEFKLEQQISNSNSESSIPFSSTPKAKFYIKLF